MGWVRRLLNTVPSTPFLHSASGGYSTSGLDPKGICCKQGPGSSQNSEGFEGQSPAEISPPLQQQENTPYLARLPYLKAHLLSSKAGGFETYFWRGCRCRKNRTFGIKSLFQSGGHLTLVPNSGAQTSTSWPLRVCWAQRSECSASVLSWGKEGIFAFLMLLYLESISSTIHYFRNCF